MLRCQLTLISSWGSSSPFVTLYPAENVNNVRLSPITSPGALFAPLKATPPKRLFTHFYGVGPASPESVWAELAATRPDLSSIISSVHIRHIFKRKNVEVDTNFTFFFTCTLVRIYETFIQLPFIFWEKIKLACTCKYGSQKKLAIWLGRPLSTAALLMLGSVEGAKKIN